MNDKREPGKIILINGASSAGKSTLAHALQQKLPEPFLHWSFDHLRESNAFAHGAHPERGARLGAHAPGRL